MTYHDRSYALLELQAMLDEKAVKSLNEAENRLDVELPVSVREWYGNPGAISILRHHSNEDPPVEICDFELIRWDTKSLLPIRYENQGVCTWAVDLDGSPDPPVYIDVDSDGREWQPVTVYFSEYVYSCIWDYRRVMHRAALVGTQNVELSESSLGELAERFEQRVMTFGWPGATQYRFSSPAGNILISANPGQADWWIGSDSADALVVLLRQIWRLDGVGEFLYDCSSAGQTALERVSGEVT